MHAKQVVLEQMRVIQALADAELQGIGEDELHWKASADSWDAWVDDGVVVADWVEPEPTDVAPPTLAWQLWHLQWWMEMVLDANLGDGTLTRDTLELTGEDLTLEAMTARCRRLRRALEELPEDDWDVALGTGWPYGDGRKFGLVGGWISMEFTKCISDMVRTRAFAAVRA